MYKECERCIYRGSCKKRGANQEYCLIRLLKYVKDQKRTTKQEYQKKFGGENCLMDRMGEIVTKYGEEYMFRQLAEECNELSQAALKLIRAMRRETPMRADEAREKLVEEIADVYVMARAVFDHILFKGEQEGVGEICEIKKNRMYMRLLDGEMEEDVW